MMVQAYGRLSPEGLAGYIGDVALGVSHGYFATQSGGPTSLWQIDREPLKVTLVTQFGLSVSDLNIVDESPVLAAYESEI